MKSVSLAFRLAINVLIALAAIVTILVGLIAYRAGAVSNAIERNSLEARLNLLIESIDLSDSGELFINMPDSLERIFSQDSRENIYIVKSTSNGDFWVSHPQLDDLARNWRDDEVSELIIKIDDVFPNGGAFHGIAREYTISHGDFLALTAQAEGALDISELLLSSFVQALCQVREDDSCTEFADYILIQLARELGWIFPLFILLLVGTVVVTIRVSLRGLSQVSARAASIDPATSSIRLQTRGLPKEIAPLVKAVNGALDRLDAGFSAERRFMANAAHELRTPLSVLKARIDKLAQAPAEHDIRELRVDVERMARVVSQLLSMARLEMPNPRREAVVLNELVRSVVSAHAPLAIGKAQELAAVVPEKNIEVRADYGQLFEALGNLVENAVVHCPAGTSIEVQLASDGTLRVVDDGPGLSPDLRTHIFERFYRADTTTGAGLGLAIVREIAQQYGGHVELKDTPGGGCTFELRLSA